VAEESERLAVGPVGAGLENSDEIANFRVREHDRAGQSV